MVSYGVHYDHGTNKKARISDFFNANPKLPEPSPPPQPAPPVPVPKPVEPPVPQPPVPQPPKPELPPEKPKDPEPAPAPAKTTQGPDSILVATLSDPPVRLQLTGGVLEILSLDPDSNKKLKKMTVLKWISSGQLVKTVNRPAHSIPYDVCLNSHVWDYGDRTMCSLKELIRKHGVSEVHGYESFPAGAPSKLVKSHAT